MLIGVIGRPHGVRGLVRVTSYADPPEAIAGYGPLFDERGRRFALRWKGGDLAEIAELTEAGERRLADRTAAERLTNTKLYVSRDRLKSADPDEFYLADLIGLRAFRADGLPLGDVAAVHDYGAGASLELSDGQIVPFTRAAVPEVDLAQRRVVVDPPAIVEAPPSPAPREGSARASAPGEGVRR